MKFLSPNFDSWSAGMSLSSFSVKKKIKKEESEEMKNTLQTLQLEIWIWGSLLVIWKEIVG